MSCAGFNGYEWSAVLASGVLQINGTPISLLSRTWQAISQRPVHISGRIYDWTHILWHWRPSACQPPQETSSSFAASAGDLQWFLVQQLVFCTIFEHFPPNFTCSLSYGAAAGSRCSMYNVVFGHKRKWTF